MQKNTLVNEVLLHRLVIVNYNLELAQVFNEKFWKQSSQNTLLIDLHLFFNKYLHSLFGVHSHKTYFEQ